MSKVVICLLLTLQLAQAEVEWDVSKVPIYNHHEFAHVAGKDKYVFIYFFIQLSSMGTGYIDRELNKVYQDFTGPSALRNDILIIRFDSSSYW